MCNFTQTQKNQNIAIVLGVTVLDTGNEPVIISTEKDASDSSSCECIIHRLAKLIGSYCKCKHSDMNYALT